MKHLSLQIARTTQKEKVKIGPNGSSVILSVDGDIISTDMQLQNRP